MITLTVTWALACSSEHSRSQVPSGSAGSSNTRWSAVFAPTLEESIPALAITNPLRCTTMITSRRTRRTSVDSRKINSMMRGSFCTTSARRKACSEATTSARSIWRACAFDTIFCAITSTSPGCSDSPDCATARRMIAHKSSPACTSGTPARAIRRASCRFPAIVGYLGYRSLTGLHRGDAYAGVCLVAGIDRDQHRSEGLGSGGVHDRSGVQGTHADIGDQLNDGSARSHIITAHQDIALDSLRKVAQQQCRDILKGRNDPDRGAEQLLHGGDRGPAGGELNTRHLGRHERHGRIDENFTCEQLAHVFYSAPLRRVGNGQYYSGCRDRRVTVTRSDDCITAYSLVD